LKRALEKHQRWLDEHVIVDELHEHQGRTVVDAMERARRAETRGTRGFASMSAEQQRAIASKGGRAAHEKGTAHEWSADEARSAGRKSRLRMAKADLRRETRGR
jgi:hypothetical protein